MCCGVCIEQNNLAKAFKSHLGLQINVKPSFLSFVLSWFEDVHFKLWKSLVLSPSENWTTFWIRTVISPAFESLDFLS